MSKKDWLKKSSRSKADLFEVLIADYLAKAFKIKKDFKKEINNLTNLLKKFENGQLRTEEEQIRAKQTAIELIKFLKRENVNNVKDVEWVGRQYQTQKTLSDVDLILTNSDVIGVSLKSTRIGLGTQKNLGYRALREHLSLNIDKEIEKMWEKIRLNLGKKSGKLKLLANAARGIIKNKKRKYPVIKKIGKKYGHSVQVKSVKQSIKNFNNLGQEEKSAFVKLIFGLEEDKRRLLNTVTQKNKTSIYWNEVYNSIISGKGLLARKLKNVSYGIYSNNKLILRLQASFTNGIGISAYCQRAFLP
ncbi:MAG: hypothetical protein CO031_01700 [Candidatus Nealsonbacteria bacterium CG_4_9_14_0_2_um_filter_37_38]|uniref:Uncharacterized protein n=1 Tax=Candidatus Nealsonbacteria bacterium CG_4_10_14_0_8_um_filter_37_14 TaxID=1974684 RepID=A0A2M7R7Y8_9BACT|nr:MAG: hypothetical protein COV63_00880 [Candidatus Nealsonbacteria bacterium CG11_big_fil_rev_8_21_14_0_20_37_68]PIY89650.1 MAG: hypothetical protein COY73_00355 [Candidatus Nealsonbacteria bacterium CG_4_10_14_0_8_um_filter_37_14]PJC51637.1 MAG: hypothetical protein CO031_01700 [Candidatus Nealsonbacteria bacterium CG_4_9_14_0_2_um_filter_37_38]